MLIKQSLEEIAMGKWKKSSADLKRVTAENFGKGGREDQELSKGRPLNLSYIRMPSQTIFANKSAKNENFQNFHDELLIKSQVRISSTARKGAMWAGCGLRTHHMPRTVGRICVILADIMRYLSEFSSFSTFDLFAPLVVNYFSAGWLILWRQLKNRKC